MQKKIVSPLDNLELSNTFIGNKII